MKTLKIYALATGLVLLSSVVFAGKAINDKPTKDTTESTYGFLENKWDYLNDPLVEVLEMEEIPTIIFPQQTAQLRFEPSEDVTKDPLQEVLEMEAIPTIDLGNLNRSSSIESLEGEAFDPLNEVLSMEEIPEIKFDLVGINE